MKRRTPVTKLYRIPELVELTGMSRSTILRMVDSGDFPKPIKLHLRANAWVDSEVQDWIASRIAEREAA